MEHRLHPRRPARVDATLYHRDEAVAVCRSRDISRDGLFLEVDPRAPGLGVGSFVTAELRWRDVDGPQRVLVSGLVVHRAPDGLGMLLVHRKAATAATVAALARGPHAGVPAPDSRTRPVAHHAAG